MAAMAIEQTMQLTRLRVLNDFISIVKARDGFEFLTSDNPVSFKASGSPRRAIPFDPTNSLWMPIDSKHLLQLEPWADQLPGMTMGRMPDGPFAGTMTSMNNSFQEAQCDKYLIGTMSGLKIFQANTLGIFKNAPSLASHGKTDDIS